MVIVSISGCGLDTDTCGGCTLQPALHRTMGRYKALLLLLPINHTIQSWHRQPATSFCPPPSPAPPPTYLSIISSPRNISMTNIYSRDGASGRTSPAPHLSCVKSCNQPAAFPPSVSHNLRIEALDDTDPESILYSKQIARYLIVDHKRK